MSRRLLAALLVLSLTTLTACESTGPRYRNVRSYSEGLAPVQSPSGLWGYVDEPQRWIIQPRFEDAQEFKGGARCSPSERQVGFINKWGEWL